MHAGKERGNNDQGYATHELWASLNRQMIDFLDSVSLRDLVERQKRAALASGPIHSPLAAKEPMS
jgi:DNA-binding IscR family transcriptional regulator